MLVPAIFASRLSRPARTPLPLLAFSARTDPRTLGLWDFVERNCEHLARQPGVRFATAAAAAADLLAAEPGEPAMRTPVAT
jgi:hypothetical protein